ncbi:hypothetical protein HK102_007568 [Quaeritorhiza haematococci]|nr:hypothetical protein HK102_007568 [Quaeritorhiza haematococci]
MSTSPKSMNKTGGVAIGDSAPPNGVPQSDPAQTPSNDSNKTQHTTMMNGTNGIESGATAGVQENGAVGNSSQQQQQQQQAIVLPDVVHNAVPLGDIIDRMVQKAYTDLQNLCEV